MWRFLCNDKTQYTSMRRNLKPSWDVMCTQCIVKWLPVFQLNILPPSSGSEDEDNMFFQPAGTYKYLSDLTVSSPKIPQYECLPPLKSQILYTHTIVRFCVQKGTIGQNVHAQWRHHIRQNITYVTSHTSHHIRHNSVILNLTLTYVVCFAQLTMHLFQQDLDLRNSENIAREGINRRGCSACRGHRHIYNRNCCVRIIVIMHMRAVLEPALLLRQYHDRALRIATHSCTLKYWEGGLETAHS